MRDASKIYGKYITEALSKDFNHAMTRFDSLVKDFKNCKSVDGTSLSLVADMLRYLGKFVEEHALDKSMTELKSAKEQIRKAMDNLDIAADKMRKGDAKKDELGIEDMKPAADSLGGEDDLGGGLDDKGAGDDLEGGKDDLGGDDLGGADDKGLGGKGGKDDLGGEDLGGDLGGGDTEKDVRLGGQEKKPSKLAAKLGGGSGAGF